ncbi:hypothetical protein ACIRCZ_20325 [Leifsonia sp. NPDC102414]|uniref:hypothetical protein n=1 Tax=Leifsonia sp. NPDC102414 TaxID=3364124 RepID=UPI0038208780
MKFLTSLRTSSALWASPFALGLTLFYYTVGEGERNPASFGYAPTLVSESMAPMYAFAYAVASSLAAWEGGRLKAGGVWQLAATRSRVRIVASALTPVLILSWFMLILPVAIRLTSAGVSPTLDSLRPMVLALILAAAHCTIGFSVGNILPRQIAAPVMAAAIFIVVAFSVSTTPYWIRHVSGEYAEPLMFGELVSFTSMWPHLLFTGSLAIAALSLWLPARSVIIRVALAAALAMTGMVTARNLVAHWGPSEPVVIGAAPIECVGTHPKVCMPAATSVNLKDVHKDAISVLRDFRAAGVDPSPRVITDRLGDGRYYIKSTKSTWRVNLTSGIAAKTIRYQLVNAAIQFPCSRPDPETSRTVRMWAATVTGEKTAYKKQVEAQQEAFDTDLNKAAKIKKAVDGILKESTGRQAAWVSGQIDDACGNK